MSFEGKWTSHSTTRAQVGKAFAVASLALGLACGGSSPPPQSAPPPSLESDDAGGGEVAEASSSAVQDGINAIQSQDFARAKEILSAAQASNPNDPQAAYYLGVALEHTDDVPGAIESYKKALEQDPKLTEAAVNLSAILLDSGDYASALEVADAGLKATPQHGLLLTNRAIALAGAGKSAEALDAYKAAVAATPENLELGYEYAQVLAQNDQKSAAVKELKKVIKSPDPAVVGAAANLLGRLEAYSECIFGLDQALKAKPNPDLYVRRGVCRHGMKDDGGALSDYKAAIDSDADFAPAHYYIGRHYLANGKPKQAREHLQKAAELGAGTPLQAAAKKVLADIK